MIIYISDNGIAFPGAKTTVYEPGIRLPCIVKDPRANFRGRVNHAMISWADLTPTILDFAGVGYSPADFHGRSFVRVLGKTDPDGWCRVRLHISAAACKVAVNDGTPRDVAFPTRMTWLYLGQGYLEGVVPADVAFFVDMATVRSRVVRR